MCAKYLDDDIICYKRDFNDDLNKATEALDRFSKAGLELNSIKREFGKKETKQFELIIKIGKSFNLDLDKTKSLSSWEDLKDVKGAHSFLVLNQNLNRSIPQTGKES